MLLSFSPRCAPRLTRRDKNARRRSASAQSARAAGSSNWRARGRPAALDVVEEDRLPVSRCLNAGVCSSTRSAERARRQTIEESELRADTTRDGFRRNTCATAKGELRSPPAPTVLSGVQAAWHRYPNGITAGRTAGPPSHVA